MSKSHFELHQLVAAEERVLAAVEQHGRLVAEPHEAVVERRVRSAQLVGRASPSRSRADQIRQEVVLERDEVAARAVERIGEAAASPIMPQRSALKKRVVP